MDKSEFVETKNYVTYKVNTQYHKKKYGIEKTSLKEVCKYEKEYSNISEWIAHLSAKVWTSKRMLLELCEIIKRIHPENKINWDETHRYIEDVEFKC